MSEFIKWYNIYELFIHLKLGSNIAVKNVLQGYVTTTMIFHAISSQKGENTTTLKPEFQSKRGDGIKQSDEETGSHTLNLFQLFENGVNSMGTPPDETS